MCRRKGDYSFGSHQVIAKMQELKSLEGLTFRTVFVSCGKCCLFCSEYNSAQIRKYKKTII